MTRSFRERAAETRQPANLAPLCMPLFGIYFKWRHSERRSEGVGGPSPAYQRGITDGFHILAAEGRSKWRYNHGLSGGSNFLHTTQNDQI